MPKIRLSLLFPCFLVFCTACLPQEKDKSNELQISQENTTQKVEKCSLLQEGKTRSESMRIDIGEFDYLKYQYTDVSDYLGYPLEGTKLYIAKDWLGEKSTQSPQGQVLAKLSDLPPIRYKSGFLIVDTYQFPIDKLSFTGNSLDEESSFFWNNGEQYWHYFGSDKNWIYSWESTIDGGIVLKRQRKADDFQLLKTKKIGLISKDPDIMIKQYTGSLEEIKNYEEEFGERIGLGNENKNLYLISGPYKDYGKWEILTNEKKIEEELLFDSKSKYCYVAYSDENYYYQFIYHHSGDYYELKRIKK